jgi:predicted DNA-binding protein YlxM (UPF0122 family)
MFLPPHLTSNNVGGKEQIPPEKQLLLLIWYISNQESMREAANLFGISISTVHGTNKMGGYGVNVLETKSQSIQG